MNVDSSFNLQGSGLSKPQQTRHSPVEKLPVELLIHIFCQCERGVKTALTLSHICRHWRAVALRVGSLWTQVSIHIYLNSSTEQFNSFISLLGTQLDRTGQLPLEIIWWCRERSHSRNAVIEDLIRRKAPFSRWKSLRARFEYDPQDADRVFHSTDSFENLEYLELLSPSSRHPMGPYGHPIIHFIDRTVTSKFHTLNLEQSDAPRRTFGELCRNMMEHARTLILSQSESIAEPLSAGITTLETGRSHRHFFPHIQTYRLKICVFESSSSIDLHSLTSLTVYHLLVFSPRIVLFSKASRSALLYWGRRRSSDVPPCNLCIFRQSSILLWASIIISLD